MDITVEDQALIAEFAKKIWKRADKKEVSYSTKVGCMYRDPNGGCCFVGALMPDDKYRVGLERLNAFSVGVLDAIGAPNASPIVQMFLRDSQRIHDRAGGETSRKYWMARWHDDLRDVFSNYNLKPEDYEENSHEIER